MSRDNSPRFGAIVENRPLLVGTALTLLALLTHVASPVAAMVVLYGP